jgi:hypothetical protein
VEESNTREQGLAVVETPLIGWQVTSGV